LTYKLPDGERLRGEHLPPEKKRELKNYLCIFVCVVLFDLSTKSGMCTNFTKSSCSTGERIVMQIA
jgi:hypothetical protein